MGVIERCFVKSVRVKERVKKLKGGDGGQTAK